MKTSEFTAKMSDLQDALRWAREHWQKNKYQEAGIELEIAQNYIEQLQQLVKEQRS